MSPNLGTRAFAIVGKCHKSGFKRSFVHVYQRVCVIRTVELLVLFCLRSSCNQLTEVRGPYVCKTRALGFKQNDQSDPAITSYRNPL